MQQEETKSCIRSYSYTFGSDETGLQRKFYAGGTAQFADISYAVDAGKALQIVHGEEKLGVPSAFSTYIYRSETNTLLVYTRCMRQIIAGRVISCGHVIVYNLWDILAGENCLNALFGIRFLEEKGILASENIKRAEYDTKIVAENTEYAPIELRTLPEQRRKTLAAVAARLMHGKQVILRLPVTKEYEAQSLTVLQQLFTLLPQRDRCEFSFVTACKTDDFKNLARTNLILTDTDEAASTDNREEMDTRYIDIDDASLVLNENEQKWLKWCNEAPDIRHDVEYSSFFTDRKEKSAEVPRRDIVRDGKYIESFYEEENLWWQEKEDERFITLDDIRKELQNNPTLSVKRYRAAFLSKDKIQRLIKEPQDLTLLMSTAYISEETKLYYKNNRMKFLLLNAIFTDKNGCLASLKQAEIQKRGTVSYSNIIKEIVFPFYTDYEKRTVSEGYEQITKEIEARIESYRHI